MHCAHSFQLALHFSLPFVRSAAQAIFIIVMRTHLKKYSYSSSIVLVQFNVLTTNNFHYEIDDVIDTTTLYQCWRWGWSRECEKAHSCSIFIKCNLHLVSLFSPCRMNKNRNISQFPNELFYLQCFTYFFAIYITN